MRRARWRTRKAGEPVEVGEFSLFNARLDEAIAHALTEYGRQRELRWSPRATSRWGEFAHEIRNLLNGASLAFGTIPEGHPAAHRSTSALDARQGAQ
jgi:hypothetical protein